MFKPRLRTPRGAGSVLRASSLQPSAPQPSSPFAAAARQHCQRRQQQQQLQQQQKRSIHATPARRLHSVPELNYGGKLAAEGVPGVYTPEGFDVAWTKYQTWCLERLNSLIAGTPLEGKETKDIAIETSREPSKAEIFNYASMAHNNYFFFDGLAVTGGVDPSEHMPAGLRADLEASFGSLETLQRELVLTADAMFGPGFVWLVRSKDGGDGGAARYPYRVLTTYHAGSPYPGAHWRRQFSDMNHVAGVTDASGGTVQGYFGAQNAAFPGSAMASGNSSLLQQQSANRSPGGADLVPVLCVNTWEHAWLFDWGIGNRFNYLAGWWNAINWGKVDERARVLGAKGMTASGAPLQQGASADFF